MTHVIIAFLALLVSLAAAGLAVVCLQEGSYVFALINIGLSAANFWVCMMNMEAAARG